MLTNVHPAGRVSVTPQPGDVAKVAPGVRFTIIVAFGTAVAGRDLVTAVEDAITPLYVNWSADDVADVPPGVMTVTASTGPDCSAGDFAVIEVALETVYDVAAIPPKYTLVAPVKPVPVMITLVPPAAGPVFGLTLVTVGGPSKVNWSAADGAEVPPGVVTVTSTVPAPSPGVVAVIEVALLITYDVAGMPPKYTLVANFKFVPVMVTEVPPPNGPAVGEIPMTVGGATKVNWSAADVADVRPGVVTVTSIVPADPAGAVTVIVVALVTLNEVAAVEPNLTEVTTLDEPHP